jgi:hypothetical protein
MVGYIVFINETIYILTSCVENQLLLTSKLQETGNINFQVLHQSMQKRTFSMQMKVVCFTANLHCNLSLKKVRHAKVGKKLKDFSVLLCCNARGEKLKPLIIGNAACPRAFKMNNVKLDDLPVIWCYNKKAWMTSEIFSEWLNEVNWKMKRANKKILLFVDNATSHVDLNLSNVAVRFLPPNLTSEVQPLEKRNNPVNEIAI